MRQKLQQFDNEYLYKAILALETMDECREFFETLCTVQELRSFAQRIQVAKMLSEGRVYNEIVESTGTSTATISRVKRSMVMGNDGYENVFKRLQEET